MTDQQTQHLEEIKSAFCHAVDAKYKAGQIEHGGNLWEKPVDLEIWAEAIDFVAYCHVMRSQVSKVRVLAAHAINGQADPVETLHSILKTLGTK
jgi:hypothetical protein